MITQGKWETRETLQDTKDPFFYHTSIICGGKRVARSSGVGKKEAKNNAALISAAPDLLALLKDILEWDGILDHSKVRIIAAVTKAENI